MTTNQKNPDKPKHAGGRPRILQSIQQAEELIESYFTDREEAERPPTICGLALHLGFEDRQSIRDYIARNDAFSCIIKKAISRIEARHEERLDQPQCTGSIFWLKNRGWSDKREHEHTGKNGNPLAFVIEHIGANDETEGESS